MTENDYQPEDILYGIDGGFQSGICIYDGVIAWALKDGRIVNRFRGENSNREKRVDAWLNEQHNSSPAATEG